MQLSHQGAEKTTKWRVWKNKKNGQVNVLYDFIWMQLKEMQDVYDAENPDYDQTMNPLV